MNYKPEWSDVVARGVTVNPYSRTKRQGGKPRETREVNVTPESNTRHNHVDKVVETMHATRASANKMFAKWFVRLLRHPRCTCPSSISRSQTPSAASPATSAVTGVPTITPATPVASPVAGWPLANTTTTSANLASERNLLGIQRSQYSVSVIASATCGRSNADWSGQNRELV
ncbi:hypothetical protein BGW80DRAFT_1254725 [Lactifluus volemus]|nr:hypothetical protein BGW80DRAFT_1254725 [Lactifluus volemus]